jgi:hypothetical protein
MRRIWNWLPAFGSSLLLAANTLAAPVAAPANASPPAAATVHLADEREMRPEVDPIVY